LHLIDRAISICSRNPIIKSPSINHDKISFVYAGDIWVAGKDGSNVQRITALVSNPIRISPNGQLIAFTGEYDGNMDICSIR
jgi:tricorn protease